jgi:hypothetical protein
MTLRTGTSLILVTQLINKITAVYGILALFTSFPLSGLQLSMYIYSLPVLLATMYLAGPLRSQSPWHALAFAYIYAVDSVINAFYTAAFGVTWFLVLASADAQSQGNASGTQGMGPGGKMMGHASGFTNPEYNVSRVEVVASPKDGVKPGQDAVAVGTPGAQGEHSGGSLAGVVLNGSGAMSIFIISAFWLLRLYAVCVVLAYARVCVRRHVQAKGMSTYSYGEAASPTKNGQEGGINGDVKKRGSASDYAEDPFAEGTPGGEGLHGKLGRIMVNIGRSYWLGRDLFGVDEPNFAMRDLTGTPASMSNKFRKSEDVTPGIHERERRRRSGTGPPLPGA